MTGGGAPATGGGAPAKGSGTRPAGGHPGAAGAAGGAAAGPAFAHASEAEMARILDYYGIAWQYEPHVFPILWNLDGKVIESFAPDFYLPELDLHLELTTLKQNLVRKKNRKLRRLRELYPDMRIKLFYARDFRALLMKYGRIDLLDSMSGTEGQVTPARYGRPAAVDAPPASDSAAPDAAPDAASHASPPAAARPAADASAPGAPVAGPGARQMSSGRSKRGRRLPLSEPVAHA